MTTVVAIGVSLNVGVLGLVLSAVDLGYQVVVPTDAVAGVPEAYASLLRDTGRAAEAVRIENRAASGR